jgi:hypothetical protein
MKDIHRRHGLFVDSYITTIHISGISLYLYTGLQIPVSSGPLVVAIKLAFKLNLSYGSHLLSQSKNYPIKFE